MRHSIPASGLPNNSGKVNNQRVLKTHCFFAHIAFTTDARVHATAKATTNLLIEINDTALTSGAKGKHFKVSALTKPQKVELAGGIARTAARDYLKLERAFRKFPVQRFVDFNLTGTPTYISICPPPTKVLPNGSKIWRLAESESDKLRTKPLSKESKARIARSRGDRPYVFTLAAPARTKHSKGCPTKLVAASL